MAVGRQAFSRSLSLGEPAFEHDLDLVDIGLERGELVVLTYVVARKEDLSQFIGDRAPSVRRRALATGRVAVRATRAS